MIAGIRQVELALGSSRKIPTANELKTRLVVRKSLVASQKITKGQILTDKNLTCKRPGTGISAVNFHNYENQCADRDYEKDELIEI